MILQRSAEWHETRKRMLTASDFSAAIGENKYKSRIMLWKEKTGRAEPKEVNEAMQWGIDHEPVAINAYEIHSGDIVVPSGLVIHPEIPWMGCSPDGIAGNRLVEVKCPFHCPTPHETIPEHYLPQVIGSLAILDLDVCDFVSWTPVGMNIIPHYRNRKEWEAMLPKLEEFWDYVINDTQPPRKK